MCVTWELPSPAGEMRWEGLQSRAGALMLGLNVTKCTSCRNFAFQGTLTRQVGGSVKNASSDFRAKLPTHFTGEEGNGSLAAAWIWEGRKYYLEGCFGEGSGSKYEFGAYVVWIP